MALLAFDFSDVMEGFRNYLTDYAIPISVVISALIVTLILYILMKTLAPYVMRKRAATALFGELARANRLSPEEEGALRDIMRRRGIVNPAVAFVRPSLLDERVPVGIRKALHEKLYGDAL